MQSIMHSSIGMQTELRKLLRHMKGLPSFSKPSSRRKLVLELVRDFVWYRNLIKDATRQVNSSKVVVSAERAQFLKAKLNHYAVMVSSVKELKHLRGLDSGEKLDPREKIRATANRVGLSVPRV